MSKTRKALAPDLEPDRKSIDTRLLVRLWGYIRPYRALAVTTLLLSMTSGALSVLQPLMAKRIIDVEIAQRNMPGMLRMSLVLGAIIVFGSLLEMAFNYLATVVGQRSMHDLRRQLFNHVMRLDVQFFDRNPVGRLITRMTSDVGTLNDLFASGLVSVLGDLLVIFGVLGLMFYFSVKLTLVVLASVPLMLLVVLFFRRKARKWYLETRRTLAMLNTYLQENISGMRTVQAFNREARNECQFRVLDRDFRDANIHTIFAYAIFFPAMGFISQLAVTAVIWVGGGDIILGRLAGHEIMTFGKLWLFVQCVSKLFIPIRTLSDKYNLLQSAMASSERIFKLLDTRVTVANPAQPRSIDGLREGIRFEDVHFAYLPAEPVLKGVSFELKRGQTLAVVGATGSGKSTLINLLTRFYDIDAGRIVLDGHDLREYEMTQLRRLFAVVLQDVFLFSGSIADNLRLASPELSDDQLWSILEQVDADDFVRALPGGLYAEVTERGGTFSTGQKQLLAFARALAADPQILVLDEATANIDSETEQKIQVATRRLLAGRTALVVAHRLSTIQRADQILVMHRGRIAEAGSHEELIAHNGLYRRLYELQYREKAIAD
jgi:ATP-binding cassette subfamily B protein